MSHAPPLARRDVIAARLARGDAVVAAGAAAEFGVSEDAIRRDLRALAREGRCRRVYGGALPIAPGQEPLTARMERSGERKTALARVGAATVRPGELVFIDSGSTNLALVDLLPEDPDLTIVTNAAEIAAAVLRRQDLRLIVVGGAADPVVGGCIDATAVAAVGAMRFDRAFVGTCAVSAADGLGAFDHADAVFKRAVLSATRQAVALVTADKLDHQAPFKVAPLDRIALLVLEPTASEAQRAALSATGCRLAVAGPPR